MKITPFDISDALDSMVCLCDTREQDTPRFRERMKALEPWERRKLDFGDYSAKFHFPGGEEFSLVNKVVVERKMHLDEIAHCFCQDRGRFVREFERAAEVNAKTYLLIENASWEHAYSGKYRSQMRSTAMIASLLAWLARYNCQLLMCKPETSGKLIKDVLYREGKERMEYYADEVNGNE